MYQIKLAVYEIMVGKSQIQFNKTKIIIQAYMPSSKPKNNQQTQSLPHLANNNKETVQSEKFFDFHQAINQSFKNMNQSHKSKEVQNNDKQSVHQQNQIQNEQEYCIICLQHLQLYKSVFSCSHSFCKICITQWLKFMSCCPACRKNVNIITHHTPQSVKQSPIRQVAKQPLITPYIVAQHRMASRFKKMQTSMFSHNDEQYQNEMNQMRVWHSNYQKYSKYQDEIRNEQVIDLDYNQNIQKIVCQKCKKGIDEDKLIICDKCEQIGCHSYCDKSIQKLREQQQWFCNKCKKKTKKKREKKEQSHEKNRNQRKKNNKKK